MRLIDIRARYGVEVILIRKPGDESEGAAVGPGTVPAPEYVIQPGDRLLVLGDAVHIERLRNG